MAVTVTHLSTDTSATALLALGWETSRHVGTRVHRLVTGDSDVTVTASGLRSGTMRLLVDSQAAALAMETVCSKPGVLRVSLDATATHPAQVIDLVAVDAVDCRAELPGRRFTVAFGFEEVS